MPAGGDAHLFNHLHAFARLQPHLRHVAQVVELRAHPRHGAIGHDDTSAASLPSLNQIPAVAQPRGRVAGSFAQRREIIHVRGPHPAVAARHRAHRAIS